MSVIPKIEQLECFIESDVIFGLLRHLPHICWLDSGVDKEWRGRFDIIAAMPVKITSCDTNSTRKVGQVHNSLSDVAIELKRWQAQLKIDKPGNLPFYGGIIGYAGYDSAAELLGLHSNLPSEAIPGAWFGLYPVAIINDAKDKKTYLVSLWSESFRTKEAYEAIVALLKQPAVKLPEKMVHLTLKQRGLTFDEYQRAFDKIQRYLKDGDCYQVNFTHRWLAASSDQSYDIYLQFRRQNSGPHSAFLNLGSQQVMTVSPERLFSLSAETLVVQPIKGTRPRGIDSEKDAQNIIDLQESEKDRAENLMIVDLLRNDLSKVAQIGSVLVEKLFQVKSFSYVHHMISTIKAKLAPGLTAVDVLLALVPGGSVTGAPKKRAVEIIAEVEKHGRSAYCGSLGYISADGDSDFNILIRTCVKQNTSVHYWAGGGIVHDSNCADEFEESKTKAKAFTDLCS